jgi:hypothetical protein
MTLSGRDFRVAVAAFVLAALPGCKQILGLHDRSEGIQDDGGTQVIKPVAGQCGSLRHPSASCAACMDQNCCPEATACHDDPACDPAWDCNMTCGDDGACRARCTTFFTRANTLVDVNVCREKSCRAECGLSCGGFGYTAPGCSACVKQTCCSTAADCAQNGDCVKLDVCRSNCIAGSSTCPPECERTYSGGVAELAPWIDCVQNMCSDACQPGRNWQCLESKTPWLKPKSAGEITFALSIVEIVSEKPFVGHTLKACSKFDKDCANPLSTAVTNEDGFGALTVPAGSVGFDGYVDITGVDPGDGSAIFPAIWYPSPNIVSSGWRGRVQFVSNASLQSLAALTGAIIDPARGHFAAAAQDCNFAAAGGVTFDADTKDDKTTVFYFVGGIPKTGALQTDPLSGIGGYINLPTDRVSLVTARVQVADTSKVVGSVAYILRPGTFTTTSIPPMP